MSLRVIFAIFLLSTVSAAAHDDADYIPSKGFVPDAKTAIAVAEAVLISVYGKKTIDAELPLVASRNGDVWTVHGTLHCGAPACLGGTAEVKLSAKHGQILHLIHYQ